MWRWKSKKVTILNTSIVTEFGCYEYQEISLYQAQCMVSGGFESAVGHKSTAEVLTRLLGFVCPMNRQEYKQKVGEIALVFKLKARAPEGVILSAAEIEKIGFSFGVLERF